MRQFKIVKKLDLKFLGEDWAKNECFLKFTAVTFSEASELSKLGTKPNNPKAIKRLGEEAIKLLEKHFIAGKALDIDGNVVEVKKEDLKNFSPDVIIKAIDLLAGTISPNA